MKRQQYLLNLLLLFFQKPKTDTAYSKSDTYPVRTGQIIDLSHRTEQTLKSKHHGADYRKKMELSKTRN